jgi:hypothetical protein
MATALLEVRDLKTWLMGRDAPVRAVDGVGLSMSVRGTQITMSHRLLTSRSVIGRRANNATVF